LKKAKAFLQLMRPANIVTSVADVLAGIAISGFFLAPSFGSTQIWPVLLLCLSTIGLYGGGVVFNDVFDAELDRIERPERPIPSGIVSIREATLLGIVLLLIGVASAFVYSMLSGFIALCIAVAAVLYDKFGKHHAIAGPVNMGVCRGLNLLLGISIVKASILQWWYLAFVPVIYIASITMISRGEVHGGNKNLLYWASLLYALVIGFLLYFAIDNRTQLVFTLIFLLAFAWMIFNPLIKAIQHPAGKNIGKAVKAGVIGLILMDASWASAFNAVYFAILIALLLPFSVALAKAFAVT
jgi:4-hydroxybenzoate polyprenyltransferase